MAEHDLLLGTAGHIDHGKTALVRALTGTDTDRLPEEKRRGITIELGFARLDLPPFRFGIIDVPGHERFVRQMVAGAAAIDVGMLVVAADDSVKPQTREHLEVMQLLGIRAGIVVLTKKDLVDRDWLALVAEEVRELVASTFLEGAPVVAVSAATGEGLTELKNTLGVVAEAASAHRSKKPVGAFRLHVDRVFPVEGHGTVVTGSIVDGDVDVGDTLVVEPGCRDVRVRALQSHDSVTQHLPRGSRAAINLAGLHYGQVRRGDSLLAPGRFEPTRCLSVRLRLSRDAMSPLKNRERARLLIGTTETLCRVQLLDSRELGPGSAGLAQLFASQSIIGGWGQSFVLRSESPIRTLGGGMILDPLANRLRQPTARTLQTLEDLESDDPMKRCAAAVYLRGWTSWRSTQLWQLAGIDAPAPVLRQLLQNGSLIEAEASGRRHEPIHPARLEDLSDSIVTALRRRHDADPLRLVFAMHEWNSGFRELPGYAIDMAVDSLGARKILRRSAKGVGLAQQGPKLSQGEEKLMARLVEQLGLAGIAGPFVKQMIEATTKHRDSVRKLLDLAVAQGDLVAVNSEYYLHASCLRDGWAKLLEAFQAEGTLTVGRIKEVLGISRKHAVPLCEFLDRAGYTRREGDLRHPVKAADTVEEG